MPSAYAHLRFGNEALAQLPSDVRLLAKHFAQLYEVGLQGPDLFFYHNPVLRTAAGTMGSRFHMQAGREFFGKAVETLRKNPSDGAKAYLFGVLGHYCLDSACHPYVKACAETGEVRHVEMETDFDRFLMRRDRIQKPHMYKLTSHIQLTPGECETATVAYPGVSARTIRRCVNNMRRVNSLTASRHRALAKTVLSFGGKTGLDMQMTDRINPRCRKTTKDLYEMYQQALERYPVLSAQLSRAISTGEPLGDDFEANFG